MVKPVIASLGLFAISVSALGGAVVKNNCPYSIFLFDVPASGGGFEQGEHTLQSGESWSQQWTELTNLGGWSIKLAKDTSMSDIMQYEYTYQTVTPDIIWFDLSDVNGNPWTGDWEVNADTDTCNPKDQAYRFATDDAYGMQSCPSDATITVTVCSGSGPSSGSSGSSPSPSSADAAPAATTVSVPSFSAPAPKPVTEAAATTQTTEAQTTQAQTTQVQTTQAQTTQESIVQASIIQEPTTPESATQASTPTQAPASTEEPASTQQPAATTAAPAFTGPWTHWGLGPDGAVVAEDEYIPGVADDAVKNAVLSPLHTTFATSVSAILKAMAGVTFTQVDTHVVTEVVTAFAGRSPRRHEHGIQKHRHHHNV